MPPANPLVPEAQRRPALARVYSLLLRLVEEASNQPADSQQPEKPAEKFQQVVPMAGSENSEFCAQDQRAGDVD